MKKVLFCFLFLLLTMVPLMAFAQPIPGACCYDNNTKCEDVSSAPSCGEAPTGDGIFHVGVTCAENPCSTGIPTMNEWGMITFAILSGLGIIYFLRRQKRAEN